MYKTLDESMSAFRPQKEKTGNLPHLSSIPRKPESLGTEAKTGACAKTKIMLHFEIQKGKEAMKDTEYHTELGATAACTLRLALAMKWCGRRAEEERKRDIFICDSWFGSVKTAEALHRENMDVIGNVKTAHKNCPLKVSKISCIYHTL